MPLELELPAKIRNSQIVSGLRIEEVHFTESNAASPGEAQTLDLRISQSILTYKYDVLIDCATGA